MKVNGHLGLLSFHARGPSCGAASKRVLFRLPVGSAKPIYQGARMESATISFSVYPERSQISIFWLPPKFRGVETIGNRPVVGVIFTRSDIHSISS